MCEFCGMSGRCCCCGYDHGVAVWEDDGGRVVDPDAPTLPAETVPEMAALTRADIRAAVAKRVAERAAEDNRLGAAVWVAAVTGGVCWLGAMAFALGKHAKWW